MQRTTRYKHNILTFQKIANPLRKFIPSSLACENIQARRSQRYLESMPLSGNIFLKKENSSNDKFSH